MAFCLALCLYFDIGTQMQRRSASSETILAFEKRQLLGVSHVLLLRSVAGYR